MKDPELTAVLVVIKEQDLATIRNARDKLYTSQSHILRAINIASASITDPSSPLSSITNKVLSELNMAYTTASIAAASLTVIMSEHNER